MSHSGSGVVERASKELSRRICSLAAKTRRASTHSTQQKHERLVEQIDTDREEKTAADLANGNGGWAHKPPKQQGTTRGSGSSSSSSGTPAIQQQQSSGNMGISRGIVMDKVTNIFSNCENTIMGNSGTKEKDINGINIPKGAVANGRAKFESSRISTEKPMRFFSRSRPGTPLLPVKAPKVPAPPEPVTPGPVKKRSNSSSNDSSTNLESLSKLKTCNELKSPRKPLITKQWLTWDQLSQDTIFLAKFFRYFSSLSDKLVLAQVCKGWREVIYQPRFWKDTRLVVHCRDIRPWTSDNLIQQKKDLYLSIKTRGMEVVCLMHANDTDVFDFIQCCPWAAKCVNTLILRCCNLTDRGLEALLEFLQGVYSLEINGCNEITEQGLWSALQPRLVSLTITDCINVADECICAITQLLPALYEFNLQAYHVTDSALSYFSPKQTGTMSIMRLQSCWEITNHGLVNIVHSLPNLTVLSLSGCSKITDDGIELIAENLQKLVCLDLSWCPRVTDAALEYIACDLNHLEQLTLDRCVLISDIGVGYVSTIIALKSLFLRWCTQIRDFGLQHVCGMRNINVLSVAGCSQLTSSGLSNLLQLRQLKELELTNCPGSSGELVSYLKQNLPECLIID